MHSLLVKTRTGTEIIEFTLREEARQELMRMLDDGHVSNYWYQMYLGFLLNDFENVVIDGETVFEIATPVEVEADANDSQGFAGSD